MLDLMGHSVPGTIAGGFIALVAVLAALVPLAVRYAAARSGLTRTRRDRLTAGVAGAIVLWLAVTGALAAGGFFARFDAMPPRFVFGVLPAFAAVVALVSLRRSRALLMAVPPAGVVAFQAFRVPVEMILLALSRSGVVPVAMTFEGQNFDILAGLTAPLVAYLCFVRRSWPRWVAIAWNALSLALLANVVRIAVLAAPGPLRQLTQEAPNLVPSLFPFAWLAYFLVPLALLGHLVSLNQLVSRERAGEVSSPDGRRALTPVSD